MDNFLLSVVKPVYNDARIIESSVERTSSVLQGAGITEIVHNKSSMSGGDSI